MGETFSDPANGYASLTDLLRFRATKQADREAYVFLQDGQTPVARLTFSDLYRQALSLAAVLAPVAPSGSRALLLYPPGLDFFTAFCGCLCARVVAIPAPPPDALRLKRTLPRLQSIVEDAQASVVLTTAAILERLDEFREHVPALGKLIWLATDVPLSPSTWTPLSMGGRTTAYLQYTSGSTSAPRGVTISVRNLLSHSQSIREGCGYTPESVTVTWLPHFHDYGLIQGLLQPLYSGHLCVVMSPLAFLKRPIRWLEAIQRYRGTHSMGPNFAFDLCVKNITAKQRESLDLSNWRYAGNGAEPIHADTIERFTQTFADCGFRPEAFCPAYGLAEATLVVSSSHTAEKPKTFRARAAELERNCAVSAEPDEKNVRSVVSCGRPMPGRAVVIADPRTRDRFEEGVVGEIWVCDGAVAEGYWSRPDETEESFGAMLESGGTTRFLRTGDLGFILDGEVHVTGRLKDLIIIAGSNHYPQDIERTVEDCHVGVRRNGSAAFAIEADGEERLVVVAELERNGGDADEILAAMRQAILEGHEVEPHALALLQSGGVLKTSSGKIQRRACRAAFGEGSLPVIASWTRPQRVRSDRGARSASKGSSESIRMWLVDHLSARLGVPPAALGVDIPLSHLGLVSRDAVALVGALEDWLSRPLSPVLVYQYPTITALSAYLSGEEPASNPEIRNPKSENNEPIAVVGVGCRFPGADGPDAFWKLLCDGHDAVSEVPADRWDADGWYSASQTVPGKMSTRWGGFLVGVDLFDAGFFGLSPAEAASMDPQQRLLLEVSWHALQHAGIVPQSLAGSRTGVFVGISTDDYARLQFGDARSLSAYAGTGSALSIAANRISYVLDLRGPSLAVDTACSSSLVAVHLAMESLRQGRTDLALAGGVNLILSPEWSVTFSQAHMMSPTGRCRTFDAAADGYVRGEGCGVVVLKRLSDAQRDGDPILAILRGSAVNQDGRSNGLTAPNPAAQQEVIGLALRDAGVSAGEIEYVECHGTGTPLGDPIEVQALAAALGEKREAANRLLIGSVKTNLGHLESAAGIAGLIKVVLSLQRREMPASLHFDKPNPLIPWQTLPLAVAAERSPWTGRFAGVSSFGFGGTNAHIILEESPAESATVEHPTQLRKRVSLPAHPFQRQRYWFKNAPIPLAPAEGLHLPHSTEQLPDLRELPSGERRARLVAELRVDISQLLGPTAGALDAQRGFLDMGMDSMMSVELGNRLQARLNLSPPLPASLTFDHPTIERLAEYLDGRLGDSCSPLPRLCGGEGLGVRGRGAAESPLPPSPSPPQSRGRGEQESRPHHRASAPAFNTEPIAIVGLGCRFPGADDPDSFWDLLRRGADAMTEVPRERWDIDAFFDPDPDAPGKMYCRWGGFIRNADQFDPAFFGISPREAVAMDPQQRLLLEVAWEALEYAGIATDRLSGTATGVFVGISGSDYSQLLTMNADPSRIGTYFGTGTSVSAAAGRIAYILGLQGPALAVDTACSSSLVALHLACESLKRGECRLALAGGVNLLLSPVANINLSRAHMLAHDPHCKTFDAAADGYVRGEGCGVIVLKRLSDALADGDNVLAVVRGTAMNQDGRSSGLTAPNGPAQEAVIRQALETAGVEPASISYVECHGTGTPLGDPIEVQALAAVYGEGRAANRPCLIGSVKTNIGHLEAAAGIAGIIKTVLSLSRREIPPHLHWNTPNPYIPWDTLPVAVARTLTSWASDGPRRAGVSSFGFIGTNAHAVLEESPASAVPAMSEPSEVILPLSAKSEPALRELARRWASVLESSAVSLADAAHTARTGRAAFPHRLVVVAASREDACRNLTAFAEGKRTESAAEEWDKLTATPGRCVPMPTYPFQRQRYWAEDLTPVSSVARPRIEAASIAGTRLRSALRERIYQARWDVATFPALADHRLFGEVVVPGAWHLAALLAALVETGETWDLEEVTFREALVLRDGESCVTQLILRPVADDSFNFELFSQKDREPEDVWTLHATGRAAGPGRGRKGPDNAPLAHAYESNSEGFYRMMSGVGIELGPRFRWLDAIRAGDGEAVASMRAAEPGEEALAPLPPGLIDSCFQLIAAALAGDGPLSETLIPLAIDAVRFLGTSREPLQGHAAVRSGEQNGETLVADVQLTDLTGRPVLLIEGFRARRASPATLLRSRPHTQDDCLYEVHWQPVPRSSPSGERRRCLLFADPQGVADSLANDLVRRGHKCAIAVLGPSFSMLAQTLGEDLGGTPTDVVHLSPLRHGSASLFVDDRFHTLDGICGTSLRLVQTLAREEGNPPRIWLITRGACPLDEQASRLPFAQAPLWGLARTIALEHPEFRCRSIDLDIGSSTPAADLLSELEAPDAEDQIALRQGQRFVPRLRPLQSPLNKSFSCSDDGTYLITGGLGGLGLEVARSLVERGARYLLLIGRSNPSSAVRNVIQQLEEAGASVTTASADVSEYDELGKVLAEAVSSMPPLKGVIHAAGILDDGVLLEQTWERFEKVLAPKIQGAWNLHRLTEDIPLDCFVLFSSAASLLGSAGQGSYAAANAFLDAFAHYRRAHGLPALSINWGPWAETGMAARNGAALSRWAGQGLRPLSPARGVELFFRLLELDTAQAAALDADWERLARRTGSVPPLLSELVRAQPASPKTATSGILEHLASMPEARRREQLLEHIRDTVAAVLQLAPDQALGERTRLFEMGLDSMMALEVRSRLQDSIGLPLPSTILFDHPTLASLADFLLTLLPSPAEPEPGPSTGAENGLTDLSEEEIERLLVEKLESLQRRPS